MANVRHPVSLLARLPVQETRAASINKKQPLNEWKAAGDPLLHLFYLKVTGIQQNAPEGAFCRVIKEF